MRKLLLLGAAFVVSLTMLLTACKKDEVNNNSNNSGSTENPGGGGGTTAEYVDLGLPSGTKWNSANETGGYNGFYTFDEAVSTFGDKLPTMEQLEELKDNCTWVWQNNGSYKVTGTNGNSIVLPASGGRDCDDGSVLYVGSIGHYWSSTPSPSDSDLAWFLHFNSDEVLMDGTYRCYGLSVRLVQD